MKGIIQGIGQIINKIAKKKLEELVDENVKDPTKTYIKIVACGDKKLWYNNLIGKEMVLLGYTIEGIFVEYGNTQGKIKIDDYEIV